MDWSTRKPENRSRGKAKPKYGPSSKVIIMAASVLFREFSHGVVSNCCCKFFDKLANSGSDNVSPRRCGSISEVSNAA